MVITVRMLKSLCMVIQRFVMIIWIITIQSIQKSKHLATIIRVCLWLCKINPVI